MEVKVFCGFVMNLVVVSYSCITNYPNNKNDLKLKQQ